MSLTLLLDLDDTLLDNDINSFLPHYLKALGAHLARWVSPDIMTRELLSATNRMIKNERADRTLEETFDEQFYTRIGIPKPDLADVLGQFYEEIFPKLRYLTRPRPEAVRLVNTAFENGFTVIIATNPLFPARAIQHRLAWADLPIEQYPFTVVSSYESFHYAKPNPAFYAECLGRAGWLAQPSVMVGNSLTDDLLPASRLNIPGFLVTHGSPVNLHRLPPLSRQGSLDQVIPWLQELQTTGFQTSQDTPAAIPAILKSTPAVFDTLGRSLPVDRWSVPPQAGEWCFTEIICHLRDADLEINIPRMERILAEVDAFLPAVNADAWSETRDYCSEQGREALKGFTQNRADLVRRLEALPETDWEKPARHAIFGPTTILELANFISQHDRTHVQQAFHTATAARNMIHNPQ
jgi:FMN phosphatase YigB (HAD superfamily)